MAPSNAACHSDGQAWQRLKCYRRSGDPHPEVLTRPCSRRAKPFSLASIHLSRTIPPTPRYRVGGERTPSLPASIADPHTQSVWPSTMRKGYFAGFAEDCSRRKDFLWESPLQNCLRNTNHLNLLPHGSTPYTLIGIAYFVAY